MGENIVKKETPFGGFGRSRKNPTPTKSQKCNKQRTKKPFSGPGSAFFGFLASFSSSWPDSWPISPNLGRVRAIFLFLGVILPFFMSEKFHFIVHLRYHMSCRVYATKYNV